MKRTILLSVTACFCLLLWNSCKKSQTQDNCALIQQVKITGARTTPYYIGDTIRLASNILPLALFNWRQTNALNDISNTGTVFIYPATKDDDGWYYLIASNPDCASHIDSVHITVINKPVTAPCNPANNAVSLSGIPSISFSSASWGLDPSWGIRDLSGQGSYGYPDFNIYFNPYWNTREPEDGAYDISNMITFDNQSVYSVFIASTYQSVYFQANPGKVYVSHVNGKLQVTFCSLTLSGDLGGSAYTTSGKLTAP
jgi:hypothetical protein